MILKNFVVCNWNDLLQPIVDTAFCYSVFELFKCDESWLQTAADEKARLLRRIPVAVDAFDVR